MQVNGTDNGTMTAGAVGAWIMSRATWPHLLFVFNTLKSSIKVELIWIDILHNFSYFKLMAHTHFSFVPSSRIIGLLTSAVLCSVEDLGFQGIQAHGVTSVLVLLERHNPFSILLSCKPSNFLNQ